MRSGIAAQRGQAEVRGMQLGAAHGRDQRIAGRRGSRFHPRVAVAGRLRRALVARRGEQRDAFLRRCRKHVVVSGENAGVDAALVLAEAHRDYVAEVVVDRVLDRTEDVCILVRFGQHQNDGCARRDGMRPFDIEADLLGPTRHVGVAWNERRETVRRDLGQVYCGKAVKGVEKGHLAYQVRILKGVDDDNRMSSAVISGGDQ